MGGFCGRYGTATGYRWSELLIGTGRDGREANGGSQEPPLRASEGIELQSSSRLAMTMRKTSLVPSPIVIRRASR